MLKELRTYSNAQDFKEIQKVFYAFASELVSNKKEEMKRRGIEMANEKEVVEKLISEGFALHIFIRTKLNMKDIKVVKKEKEDVVAKSSPKKAGQVEIIKPATK